MTAYREYRIQMKDAATGQAIITAGGACHVSTAGSPDKATLYDSSGAALANPITPTRGFLNFFTLDSVASVDLYVQAPGGQFEVRTSVVASGPNEILVDTSTKQQMYKIPFSITDSVAATEKDTGFDLPATCLVLDRLNGAGIYVTAIDATETIDVGTLTGETGADPNGLNAAASVGTLGALVATNGALHSSNAPYASDANAAKSISYTLTTGSDTAKGYILLPIVLI